MKTKQEVINFLESKVGTKVVCVGNSSLDGQCVTLIKSLMDFLGVPDPYKARGHAKTCISAYLNEGIAKQGIGFLSVFSNKDMGSGYGHIWCNVGDKTGYYYESNGQKALTVTKSKTYSYDTVCNFDQYIIEDIQGNYTTKTYTEEEMTQVRLERDNNWNLYQTELKNNQGLEETIKSIQGSHKDFVENLLKTLSPIGNPLGLADEELVKKMVVEAVKVESDLQAKIKEIEKTNLAKQEALEKENSDLKVELQRLSEEINTMEIKHKAEIEALKGHIDNVAQRFVENKIKKEDLFDKLADFIINLFERKNVKKVSVKQSRRKKVA
jgi:hypothetical protein